MTSWASFVSLFDISSLSSLPCINSRREWDFACFALTADINIASWPE